MKTSPLDLDRLNKAIRSNSAHFESPNNHNVVNLDAYRRRRNALASSAIALAHRREAEHGPDDLDSYLYQLIGETEPFYNAQLDLDTFREETEHMNWHDVPEHEKELFNHNREVVTTYNDTVHEIIELGAAKFNFDELVNFMTDAHVSAGGGDSADHFYQMAHSTVVGMRTEVSVGRLLRHNGIDYTLGSRDQDIRGGDIFIAGVPLDLKTTEFSVTKEKRKAKQRHRDPKRIIWAGIHEEDYRGGLVLPRDKYDEVSSRLMPQIRSAIGADALRRAG